MDAFTVLENSYYAVNRNFSYYKTRFEHEYYLNVKEETYFIDKLFDKIIIPLSAQDKMLNYSVSSIYTAVIVLIEYMNRNKIIYEKFDINSGQDIFEISNGNVRIPSGGKTWNFTSDDEHDIKEKMEKLKQCDLKEVFDVCVGIKTTADAVFVKPMTREFVEENQFENEVIYPLIQSFDVNRWEIRWGNCKKDRYILYPHKEQNGTMVAYALEEIPKAGAYLRKNESALKNRTYLIASKTREGYDYF